MEARNLVYWVRVLLGAACGSVFGILNLSETIGLVAALVAIPAVYMVTTAVMWRCLRTERTNFNVKTEGVFSYVIIWLLFWTLLMNLLYPRL